MRFRLHNQNANSGQVNQNKTAIAALSSQVDAVTMHVPGLIAIGVNDTFAFRVLNNVVFGDVIHPTETYTLVLAERGYTPTEMAAALNVAIVVHDNEANSITGTMGITSTVVLEDDKFAIKCTSAAGTTLVRGIDILGSSDGVSNSAGETLGFAVGQSIGPVTSGDLTLVATNEPIAIQSQVTTVTTQVTGDDDVHTVGAVNINSSTAPIAFADAFSNGISHALDSSLFNVTEVSDYTINVQLRVTAGTSTGRGLYRAYCRRYKNRTTTTATGDVYRDYFLGSCYYRENQVVLGGNVRIRFESTTEQFEIIVKRAYQNDNNANLLDNSSSWITIEKHDVT
jgi:hypothetical protein